MKSFQQFISESINISGNASVGTIIVGGTPQQSEPVGESFLADVVWQGRLYRMEVEGRMMNKNQLAEQLQKEYPGAIVHNIYPVESTSIKVKNAERYRPERLSWSD